jgi:hypothetical protein
MWRALRILLVAFAMLASPVATMPGAALAADPGHHAAAADSGHCQDLPDRAGGDSAVPDLPCCTATCSVLAAQPAVSADAAVYGDTLRFGLPERTPRAFLAKLPTPPPRRA